MKSNFWIQNLNLLPSFRIYHHSLSTLSEAGYASSSLTRFSFRLASLLSNACTLILQAFVNRALLNDFCFLRFPIRTTLSPSSFLLSTMHAFNGCYTGALFTISAYPCALLTVNFMGVILWIFKTELFEKAELLKDVIS